MNPSRGEVWWANLDPTVGSEIAKTRPCVVLTRDLLNEHRRTVVVVPLSSSPAPNPPLQVAVRCNQRPAIAVTDQIRAVSKQRLKSKIGMLTEPEVEAIENALRQILDLA